MTLASNPVFHGQDPAEYIWGGGGGGGGPRKLVK